MKNNKDSSTLKTIKESLLSACLSVLPITIIILVLGISVGKLSSYDVVKFLIASVFIVLGMSLFLIGASNTMLPIGQNIGNQLSKKRKLFIFILISFVLGFIITLAEPDLMVFASQFSKSNVWLFVVAISLGVGIYLTLGILRIIFNVKLTTILLISYGIIILLSFFVPSNFLPFCFDSGSITTGPISSPFFLAFGLGISAMRSSGKSSDEDSFGIIALCSTGPIIVSMILSLFLKNISIEPTVGALESVNQNFSCLLSNFGGSLIDVLADVSLMLVPILIVFLLFNKLMLKLNKKTFVKIILGFLFTFLGMTLFLTGINTGYLPISSIIGFKLGSLSNNWIIYPICLLIGFTIVFAEPAIQILNKKIEQVTGGMISKRTMMISVAVGVALSLALIALKVLLKINFIWIIIPLYIAIVVLSIFSDKVFVAIAFDSGGVATGSMTSGFILPLVVGICCAVNADILSFAFGTAALISALPILVILIMGVIFKRIKTKKEKQLKYSKTPLKPVIIEFDTTQKEAK